MPESGLNIYVALEYVKTNVKHTKFLRKSFSESFQYVLYNICMFRIAKQAEKLITIVIVLPDSGVKYLLKIYSDDWMKKHNFLE